AFPQLFRSWGGVETRRLILPLIQLIMFGIGARLSIADFQRVITVPRPVLICVLLQYTVMPLTGFALATLFKFEASVAAGVILIGSCSAGIASNVMVYLAHGSIPLSVTMTVATTLLAPLLTPLWMQWLAGQYVAIPFMAMMLEILQMIVLPILAGVGLNRLLNERRGWLDKALPVISMTGICIIVAIIVALSRDKLLEVGIPLIAAVMLHNAIGYVLGYAGARAFGLDESTSRTVSFVVGIQNGGMGSGLAINVLKSPATALAPAVFGAWMNISGSILASFWRGRALR
ncbi:MAG TPA: bile acid:sodium symporter family protein, partial [Bryobacteraceae bacterium]|nr:bile acid:sodium symporter family protein [Bryobacteraceae bacterium]